MAVFDEIGGDASFLRLAQRDVKMLAPRRPAPATPEPVKANPELVKTRKDVQARIDGYQRQLDEVKRKVDVNQKTLRTLQSAVDAASADLAEAKRANPPIQADIIAYARVLANKTAKRDALKKIVDELNDQVRAIEGQITDARAVLAKLA